MRAWANLLALHAFDQRRAEAALERKQYVSLRLGRGSDTSGPSPEPPTDWRRLPNPLPPAQKIEQCPKDSPISVLVVPPRYAVCHEEDDGYRHRDDQDGSHRFLPFSSTAGHVPLAVRGELDDGRRDVFGGPWLA